MREGCLLARRGPSSCCLSCCVCQRVHGWTTLYFTRELCEGLRLYLFSSRSPFLPHRSLSTSISVCFAPRNRLCLGPFCVCLSFCYRVSFLFSSPTSARALQCLSPPVSPVFLDSLTDFVMRAIVDDGALGDLLLDPASVRCRDERNAMKGGWETGRSRWKIERYTGR